MFNRPTNTRVSEIKNPISVKNMKIGIIGLPIAGKPRVGATSNGGPQAISFIASLGDSAVAVCFH